MIELIMNKLCFYDSREGGLDRQIGKEKGFFLTKKGGEGV